MDSTGKLSLLYLLRFYGIQQSNHEMFRITIHFL